MSKCIRIKLAKDEITIVINEEASMDKIKSDLSKEIVELKKLYKDEKTPINVSGKFLKNEEMDEIEKIIKKEIPVKITFDSPKTLGLHGIKQVFNKEIETSQTKYYKGSLRCGQKIEFEGSIVILGDLNGGAEAFASDNIVVLGNLRGLAHAGAKGNKKAIIAAHNIDAPQIRIANIVKEMNKNEIEEIKKSYAYIEGEEIVVE